MKKIFVLVMAFCLAFLFAGTPVKKSGQKTLHNYMYTNSWDFDTTGTPCKTGAVVGTNTDTLILYSDSATSVFFNTASLRVQGLQAGTAAELPDSVKYCVLAKDDALDAITLRTEYQIRNRANATWMTVGGNGDIALAGAGVPVFSCFGRQFVPSVDHRVILHPTTTTDSASIKFVKIFSIRK